MKKPIIKYQNELRNIKPFPTVSCIIPAWNEATRIAKVLQVIYNYPFFHEIIVVDDGSTDNTSRVVKDFIKTHNCTKINIIEHETNQGKSAAVITGVNNAQGKLIVLLDADLIGLTSEYIDKMLYYELVEKYDMVILDRGADRRSPIGWSNLTRFFGGERVFWKKDFIKASIKPNDKYNIEILLNMYFLKHGKRVRTVYCPELDCVHQYKKMNPIKGIFRYINMFWNVYKKAKIKNFYLQIRDIEEDRIEELYRLQKKVRKKSHGLISITPIIVIVGFLTAGLTFIALNVKKSKAFIKVFKRKM